MARKLCLFCREWFEPYAPQAKRQKICGRTACRRKLKRTLDRAWRRRDPRWREGLLKKRREGRRIYMRRYRAEHPAYRAREAASMRARRARARLAPQLPVGAVVTQER
jgi:hypothetical protein